MIRVLLALIRPSRQQPAGSALIDHWMAWRQGDDPAAARAYLDELAIHAGKRWEQGRGGDAG